MSSQPLPTGGEREICDRPTATANTALVRCLAFGPPLHHRLRPPSSGTGSNTTSGTASDTSQLVGSFFAATSGGAALFFALFADNAKRPSRMASRQATRLQLQHRAPIVALRLIDTKTQCPLLTSCKFNLLLNSIFVARDLVIIVNASLFFCSAIYSPHFLSSTHHQFQTQPPPPPPHLMVLSEEQVRLFALPSVSLRQKARITAKDGFRIKTGDIMAFGQFSSMNTNSLHLK